MCGRGHMFVRPVLMTPSLNRALQWGGLAMEPSSSVVLGVWGGDNSHPWFWHMEIIRTGEELSDASPDAGRADTRRQPSAGAHFTHEHLTRDLRHLEILSEKKKSSWRARRGEIEDKVGMRREKINGQTKITVRTYLSPSSSVLYWQSADHLKMLCGI